jgi:hypothetical protein
LWYFVYKYTGVRRVEIGDVILMEHDEFYQIRKYLGKTQLQTAVMIGVSLKAIQSFEQGWRSIPVHTERQLLFLLYLKQLPEKDPQNCWDIRGCDHADRQKCASWEFQAGHLCWFINGTMCHGKAQENWQNKIQLCRQCEVFQSLIPTEVMLKHNK